MMRPKDIDDKQCLETLAVLGIVSLVVGLATDLQLALYLALAFLFSALFLREPGRYAAWAALTAAEFIGKVVSTIVLALIFSLLITPMGLISRAAGRVPRSLGRTRPRGESYFTRREKVFTPEDFEKTW